MKVDLSQYNNTISRTNQLLRLLWSIVWPMFTWFLPRSIGSSWKRILLTLFGASIHKTAKVYSSAKVYYPANLEMHPTGLGSVFS